MLTNSSVLEFIKFELGFPFTEIELLDDDIIYRCKEIVLKRFFSRFVPVFKYKLIDISNPDVKTNFDNRFKILDEDGAGILTVFDVIMKTEILTGLNMFGSQGVSYSELPNWYQMYMSRRTATLTTHWYTIFEFVHPIYIDIRPKMLENNFMVCYEAQHVSFETIPTYREPLFLDLAIGYIKKNIAQIRSKYQTIETTFGEVRLNWEDIKSEGKEIWDNTIIDLKKIPPRIPIHIG